MRAETDRVAMKAAETGGAAENTSETVAGSDTTNAAETGGAAEKTSET